jgi:hypothetical protein
MILFSLLPVLADDIAAFVDVMATCWDSSANANIIRFTGECHARPGFTPKNV